MSFYKAVLSDKFNGAQHSEIFGIRGISYFRSPVCSYERGCHSSLKIRFNYVGTVSLLLLYRGINTIPNT